MAPNQTVSLTRLFDKVPWNWLTKWSAAAFVVGGLVQLLNLGLHMLPDLINMTAPELVRDWTLVVASIAALIGLLGLVTRLDRETHRLARLGSGVVVLAIIGQLAVGIGEPIIGGDVPPTWFMPLFLLHWLFVPLSFLVFGWASLRTRIPSRAVGLSLLVIFVAFLFFHHLIPLHVEGVLAQIPSIVIGLAMVGTGYLLQGATTLPDHSEHTTA